MTEPHSFIDDYRMAFARYRQANAAFKQLKSAERISIVRFLLESNTPPVFDNAVLAFHMLPLMVPEEKQEFVGEIVQYIYIPHPFYFFTRDIILSLPEKWLIENIETYMKPLLEGGGHGEYHGVLELYRHIDHRLMLRLAKQILTHADPQVREAGEYYLERYG